MLLTDRQWTLIEPYIEMETPAVVGRPPADRRKIFEAILFLLYSGMQWQLLPDAFPPKSTVREYLLKWCRLQKFRRLFSILIRQLIEHGDIRIEEDIGCATVGAFDSRAQRRHESIDRLEVDDTTRKLSPSSSLKVAELSETESACSFDPLYSLMVDLGASRNLTGRGQTRFKYYSLPPRCCHRRLMVRIILWLKQNRRMLALQRAGLPD